MYLRRGGWIRGALSLGWRHLRDTLWNASNTRLVRFLVLGAVLSVAVLSIYRRVHSQGAGPCVADFSAFYQSALVLRHGSAPYGPLADWIRGHVSIGGIAPFTPTSCLTGPLEFSYTPFFALLMIPFTWLPYGAALLLWDVCNLLLLGGAIYAFLRAARISPTILHTLLLTGAVILTSPLRFELYYAQADLFMLFFICASLWARNAERPALAGMLLAVACTSEPVLLAVVAFLLWKRELKFAAVTLATSVVSIFAPFLWLGGKALQDLFVIWRFYASDYAVVLTNDAPRGILLRLLTPNVYVRPLLNAPGLVTPLWLLLALAVLLIAAALISRRPLAPDCRSLLDVGLIVAALLLISPWSENSQFTQLVVPFLAVYVCLRRIGWRTPAARRLLMGFGVALLLAYVSGDTLQYSLIGHAGSGGTAAYLYVLLGATYLYTLLAISAVIIYAQRSAARAAERPYGNAENAASAAGASILAGR